MGGASNLAPPILYIYRSEQPNIPQWQAYWMWQSQAPETEGNDKSQLKITYPTPSNAKNNEASTVLSIMLMQSF